MPQPLVRHIEEGERTAHVPLGESKRRTFTPDVVTEMHAFELAELPFDPADLSDSLTDRLGPGELVDQA